MADHDSHRATVEAASFGVPVGRKAVAPSRTVTALELAELHRMLGVIASVHVDPAAAAKTAFGEVIASGPLVAAMVATDWTRTDLFASLTTVSGLVTVAGLSMTVTYRDPVRSGDTLLGAYQLASARESASRPGHLVLTVAYRGENQLGRTVIEGTMTGLWARADAPAAPSSGDHPSDRPPPTNRAAHKIASPPHPETW